MAHLHWGMEHELYPTASQIEIAHALAERGVDVIVGHHPHVVQPLEHYRTRRDPHRVVPIAYSLGNLVNPFEAPWLRHGGVLELALCKGRCADGRSRTYVRRASLLGVELVADDATQTLSLRATAPRDHSASATRMR